MMLPSLVFKFIAVGFPVFLDWMPPSLALKQPGVKVIGGVNATEGEFPYLLSLQMNPIFGDRYHYCGGVILDTIHVITAAQCIYGRVEEQIEVVAGAYNVTNFDEPNQQRRKISFSVIHDDFDPDKLSNDMALLILDSPLQFNSYVQPVTLPDVSSSSLLLQEPGQNCTFVGWGSVLDIIPTPSTQLLQKLNMTIVSSPSCESIYQYIKPINETTMICAKGLDDEKVQGPCKGDAGGALLCLQESENQLAVVGLMSWSMIPCGDASYPSIFTNIWTWDMIFNRPYLSNYLRLNQTIVF